MSINPINNLSSHSLMIPTVVRNSAITTTPPSTVGSLSGTSQPDSSQLSPFAQMMSLLQQLQQTNPTQYQQVTQQIATNLQNAAQTAQAQGNTTAASELNQLSTDFGSASQSGQLPSVSDLAQAVGGHHHHGHHAHAQASSDSSNASLNQLLSAFQTSGTSSDALNPTAIIMNTLSAAGISSNA